MPRHSHFKRHPNRRSQEQDTGSPITRLRQFWTGRHQHQTHPWHGPDSPANLSQMSSGQTATVLDFRGGRMVTNRLASLGFTPGVQVEMIQNIGHGPLIVTVRGTRVALGRGEAFHIIVEMNGK